MQFAIHQEGGRHEFFHLADDQVSRSRSIHSSVIPIQGIFDKLHLNVEMKSVG